MRCTRNTTLLFPSFRRPGTPPSSLPHLHSRHNKHWPKTRRPLSRNFTKTHENGTFSLPFSPPILISTSGVSSVLIFFTFPSVLLHCPLFRSVFDCVIIVFITYLPGHWLNINTPSPSLLLHDFSFSSDASQYHCPSSPSPPLRFCHAPFYPFVLFSSISFIS